MSTLSQILDQAHTPAQQQAALAIVKQAAALAASRGYHGTQVREIHVADDGTLASIELGQDADGMCRVVLNFAL